MDICVLFSPQLSSRTISFDSLVKSDTRRRRHGAGVIGGRSCHAAVLRYRLKRDAMAANYISQLSETDVQYNLVSANRQIFKQE